MPHNECNCEFCEKCPYCGHRADEHMAGDFECGICYMCEKEGKYDCHNGELLTRLGEKEN